MQPDSGDSRPVIGHLAEASGTVVAVAPDGSKRILEPGDTLYLHDRVFTEPGHTAAIELLNHQILNVEDHARLVLVESMLYAPDSDVDALTIDEEFADILADEEDDSGVSDREQAEQLWDSIDSDKHSSVDIPRMPVVEHENTRGMRTDGAGIAQEYRTDPFQNLKTLNLSEEDDQIFIGQFQSGSRRLTYRLISPPGKGTVTLGEDGQFRFDPGDDFHHLDDGESLTITFTFETEDDQGNRNENTVDITVEGINNAPEVSAPVTASLTQEDGLFTLDLLAHATDLDANDELFVNNLRLVSGNEAGVQISIDGAELIIDPGAYRFLAEDETETLSYEYRITDTTDSIVQTATITLSGTNDAPTVSQAILRSGNEDSGTFTVDLLTGATDIDTSDSLDVVSLRLTAGDPRGISLSPDGNSLEVDTDTYDYLANGQTETIEYSYEIEDGHGGSVTQHASIVLHGSDDAPVIGGADSGSVTEDAATTLTVSDQLTVTDADAGESRFNAGIVHGDYGSLTIDANGHWTYTASNNQNIIQSLPDGDSLTEMLAVSTADGTSHNIVITLHGANDPAVFSADDSGTVSEDSDLDVNGNLVASGTLEVTDTDTGEAAFNAESVMGDHGNLVIDADGNWRYEVDNSLPSIQELGDGITLTEILTVSALDNSSHTITITINGANDGAVIGGVDTGYVIENQGATLTTSGALTVSDIDAGEQSFSPLNNHPGTYGSLSISSSGQWNYSVSNTHTAIQALNTGDSLADIFTVNSLDGEAHTIVVTIYGSDGDAIITGDNIGVLTEDDTSPNLVVSGDLDISDPDPGESTFTATTVTGDYGSLTIDASGHWDYTASNSNSDIQALASGSSLQDAIVVTSADGTAHVITITIHGTDDTPVIGGVDTGSVTEDSAATLTVSNQLSIVDPDSGQTLFMPATVEGIYGSLSILADGSWTYTADNTQDAIQNLPDGSTLTDTLTVDSADGTSHDIIISIHGVNDAAVFTGDDRGTVSEDSNINADGNLVASGQLQATDTDSGESLFTPEVRTGMYGSLTISTSGSWEYTADNSQSDLQSLGHGDTLTEMLAVHSDDGSSHTVTITIQGTNDQALITGTDTGAVTENAAATLQASGILTITDPDTGESSFTAANNLPGDYGTLSITTNGQWSYQASNSHADIQSLNDGDTLTDTITVSGIDGTDHTITITIHGTDGNAVIGGTDTGTVTEDDSSPNLIASGTLTITDPDAGEASFNAISSEAGHYGSLGITSAGSWTYTVSNSHSAIQGLTTGETLIETFTVNAVDGTARAITITIQGRDDIAVIGGTSTATLAEDSQGQTLSATGTLTIIDRDLGQAAFQGEDQTGDYGTLSIEPDGSWSYSVANSETAIQQLGQTESLTEIFTVRSVDGTSQAITITLTGVNDPPVVSVIDLGASDEDQQFIITEAALLAGATDTDGDSLSVSSVSLDNSAHGTLTDNGDNTWTFIPSLNFNGNDVGFSFTVSDGTAGDEVTSSATLDITALNDAPVLISNSNTGEATVGGTAVTGATSVLADDSDADNDPLSVVDVNGVTVAASGTTTITGQYGDLTIGADGLWSYQPVTPDLTTDLVGHWQFDGNTVDSATGDAVTDTGTLRGGADTDGTGLNPGGSSLSLASHGDGFVITSSSEINSLAVADRTIHFSFRIDAANSLSGRQVLFDEGGATRGMNAYLDNNKLYIGGYDRSIDWNGTWYVIDAPTDNDFHSLTLTLGNNLLNAYLDGSQLTGIAEDTSTGTRELSAAHNEFAFGARHGGMAFHDGSHNDAISSSFIGDIDEARIFNRELTDQELSALNYEFFSGTLQDQFIYTVSDGAETRTATLSIDVNRAPEAQSGMLAATEDGAVVSGQLSVIDLDSGENPVFTKLTDPAEGSVTVNADGSYQFDPGADFQDLAAGETRTVTFSYQVEDNQGDTDTAQVSITVTGVNDAPSSISLSSSTVNENAAGAVIGQLTVSDIDASAAPTISVDDSRFEVVNGQLKLKDGISLDHESAASLVINVTATDDQGDQRVQAFTLTVSDLNDAPVLTTVTSSITEDTGAQVIDLLAGATDQDGDTPYITNLVKTAGDASGVTITGSTLQIDTTAYQSLGDEVTETLTYTYLVNDGNDGSTSQTATITITGTNDGAVISGVATGALTEDNDNSDGNLVATGSLSISDADDSEASFTPGSQSGDYGTLVITAAGSWTYTASNSNSDIQSLAAGSTLTDDITVSSVDGTQKTITVTITGTDDSPTIGGDTSASLTEDTAVNSMGKLTASGTLTITDADTGESAFSVQSQTSSYGTLDISADGSWTYSALNSQSGIQNLGNGETLTDIFTVSSADSTPETITITITGTNDAPVISAGGSLAYTENSGALAVDNSITLSDIDSANLSSATITISSNFQSGEDLLAFTAQNGITSSWNAATGTLTLSGTATLAQYQAALRSITYTNSSDAPDTGARTISFKVNDGVSDSTVATSTVSITAVNDNPVGGHIPLTISEDTPHSFLPTDFPFTDAEGSQLQGIKITTLPVKGELLYNGAAATTGLEISRTDLLAGRLTYRAEPEDSGNNYAIFEFQVSDGQLYSTPATITFHVSADNDTPTVSSAITGSGTENDQAFSLDLLQYASDVETPDDLAISGFTLVSGDSRGISRSGTTLNVDPDDYDYLVANQVETIVYRYNVEDAGGISVVQTATITITGTNDLPTITGSASGSVTEDSSVNAMGDLTVSDRLIVSDADTGESSFMMQTLTGDYGSLSIAADGNWTYTADNSQDAIQELDSSETLIENFTVRTADNTSHSISITLNGANDAPVVDQGLTAQTATEEVAFSYQIPANAFSDRDGETPALTATLSDGSDLPDWLSFDQDSGAFSGTPDDGDTGSITIKVTASDGDQQTSAQFTLTTAARNDPPELSPSPLIDNLITALNFNTGAGISASDSSGSDNHATLAGSATWVVDRHGTGSALNMDGTAGSAELSGIATGGAMTIATWVRFESFAQSHSRIIDFGNGQASDNIVLSHKGNTNALSFDIYGSSGITPHSTVEIDDFFPLNEWVHVTATIAADGTLRVYKNGHLAGEVAGTAPAEIVRSGNYLGKSHWGGDGYLDGSLDDFVLVSETLDAAEVSALYLAGSVDNALANSFHVPENSAAGTVVGTVHATDVDSSNLTYSLTSNAGGRFAIDNTTGEITVTASANLDKETVSSYDITVEVSDGALTDTETYTIRITDVAEAPIVSAPIHASGTDDSGLILVDLLTGATAVDEGATLSADSITLTRGDGSGITINGNSLSVDASAYAYLPNNYVETITYSYNVLSSTGVSTPQSVTITLTGRNEGAVISGVDRQTVTEDDGALLTTSGTLSIQDTDSGEASFRAGNPSGDYGSLQINTLGAWTYSVSSTLPAIQQLGRGDTLTDILTVTARDGTTHAITITIDGTNDAAVISGVDTGLVVENAADTLTATGALSISDTDTGEEAFTPVVNRRGAYGSLSMNDSGQWTYTASNSQSALQSLNTGDSLTDIYTIQSVDGEEHDIVITILGSDGDATITGDSTATLTEDSSSPDLTASGDLTVVDEDPGESAFRAENIMGTYGSLTIDAGGHWEYSASNSNTDIQGLTATTSLADILIVTSIDGSAHAITITITGTDDAPVIGGVNTGTLTEDTAASLIVSGQLTITDADAGEDEFTADMVTGDYGDLTIASDGSWSYTASNSDNAIQNLPDGSTLTDILEVATADGTTHSITITINGANDEASFSGDDTGAITEDLNPNDDGELSTSGSLVVSDTDTGEASFMEETIEGDYGDLMINTAGSWSYVADNSLLAIQALGDGDSLTDIITVTSDDDSTHTITITINGTNDAATITGTNTGSVTENAATILRAAGNLTIQDTDADEDSFDPATNKEGDYGHLSITADGQWHYEATNNQPDILALSSSDTLTDIFTVNTLDGTPHSVTITIQGTDGNAIIGGTHTGNLVEDASTPTLSTSGSLTIQDTDPGEASFVAQSNLSGTYGSLEIDTAGQWTYRVSNSLPAIQSLANGETLIDTITIRSVDQTPRAITITITGTNDLPTFSGTDTGSLTEDSASLTLTATGTLTISDQDSGESGFVDEDRTGDYGTLSIESDGRWTYTALNNLPAIQELGQGETLVDIVSVRSIDGSTKNITITITGTDDAPRVSSVDLGASDEDQQFTITANALLASASDTDGDTLSVSSVSLDNSAFGSLVDNGDNTWTFTPTLNYNGDDVSFSFTVSDGTPGDEATASATLDITALNDAPDLTDDTNTGQASQGGPEITGVQPVLHNDLDVDGDTLTVTEVNGASVAAVGTTTIAGRYGSLEIAADGSWSYTPSGLDLDGSALDDVTLGNVDLSGTDLDSDLVAYWSFDEGSGTSAADSAPADTDANDGNLHGDASFTTGGLYGNAVSLDGSGDLVEIVDSTELNILTENQNQRTISLGFQVDSSNVLSGRQILFESGGSSNGYNLYIDSGTLYVGAWSLSNSWNGEWLSIDLSGKDMTKWHQVSLVLDADSSSLKAYFDGVEFDSAAASAMANHGDEAAFGRLSRRSDGSYGSTRFHDTESTQQDYGFSGKIDEAYIYNRALSSDEVIALNYQHKTLTDTFVYQVSDSVDSSTATLSIDVNRSPIAQTGQLSATEDGGTVSGQLSAIDWDDGDTLTYTPETLPARGTLSITSSTGAYTYNPDAEFQNLAAGETENITFTYRVTDTQNDFATATVTITITGTNDDAVITDSGSHSVTEDAGATLTTSGTLGISDTDDGQGAFVPGIHNGAYGSVTINAAGAWTYSVSNSLPSINELDTGETLTDTITLSTDDGTEYDLLITINGSNDAPVLVSSVSTQSVNEDAPFSFQVPPGTFSDAENNIQSYTASLSNGQDLPRWLTFDPATQTFSGTPDNDDVGSLAVRVTATDTGNLAASATFNLIVNNVNDLPVAVFQESGGLLSIEAESFHASVTRSGNSWTEENQAAASGGKVVSTTDSDQPFSDSIEGNNPELTYEVNFQTPGTYYVWIRGSASSASSDSVHLGLNGEPVTSATGISGFATDGNPDWGNTNSASAVATVTVTSAGTHQLNLWAAEDGFKADKIVLTTDSTYTPNGAGPAESAHVGSAPQTATEESLFSYTIPAIAFLDMDGDTLRLSASLQNNAPLPSWLSFDEDSQTFSGTPDDPDLGTLAIKVIASDDSGSTEVLFNLNVAPVNDAPDLVDDLDTGHATVAGTQITGASSVLDNDSDVDSATLTVTDVNGVSVASSGSTTISGEFGDLSIDSDGNWTYSPVDADVDSGLVGLWRFEGNNLDTAASDTVADDGSLRGSASTGSAGLSGNGLTLPTDGDAFVIPTSTEINDGSFSDRTISLAFKIDPANTLTSRQVLFEEGGLTRGLNAYFANNTLYVGGYDTSIGWTGTWYSISAPADNDWHNISLVLGNNGLRAYLDRNELTTVVQDDQTGTRALSGSHAELSFGALHGDTKYHDFIHNSANDNQISTSFTGQLDEARVYNRALTKQQVNALHYEFETTNLVDRFTYTASDGTDSRTAALTIDVNRAPRALSGTLSATEDSSVAGTLSAIDFDAGEILTYELVTDTSEGSATVNTDGTYSFSPGSDFQNLGAGATRDVSFTYRVTDSRNDSSTATVTITVTGTNDAPVLQSAILNVDENSSDSTAVGTVTATDVDVGDTTIIYRLTDDAGGRFAIDSSTGAITVADGALLNHENNDSHDITVQVSDGVDTSTHTYTITINDVNDAPTASDATLTEDEDTDLVLTLAHFGYSDEDSDDLDKVQITDLPDSGTLQLSGVAVSANDEISRANIVAGNLVYRAAEHESGSSYASLDFKVHDGTVYSDSAYTLTIDVTAVADEPTLQTNNQDGSSTIPTDLYNASFGSSHNGYDGWTTSNNYLNAHSLNLKGNVSRSFDTSNRDNGGYSIEFSWSGYGGPGFKVYWDDTLVTTVSGYALDGRRDTVTLPAPTSDSTTLKIEKASGNFLYLRDVIFTQHIATPYYEIDEDHSASIDLTTQLVDTDSSESLAISVSGLPSDAVISDGDGNSFTSTGTAVDITGWDYASLSVLPPLHHDTDFTLTFSATATESSNNDAETVTQNVEIRVTPINDAAEFGGTDSGSVTEDSSTQATGTLTVSDVDDPSEEAFQSVSDITGIYGSLSISSAGVWTYTIDNSRAAVQAIAAGGTQIDTISVQSVDGTTKNISVTVTGVNDAPVLPSPSLSIDENSSNSTSVGSVAATDVDSGDTLTYTMTDDAGGRFQIDSSTGEITVADGSQLDHEANGSHTVTVEVSDDTATDTQTYTITVNDINDAPTSADKTITINEDTNRILTSSDFAFTDEDSSGDTLSAVRITALPAAGSLTLSGTTVSLNQEITIADINAGLLVYRPADHASGNNHASFDFKVSDGSLLSASSNRVIFNVTPVVTPPTLSVDGDVVITTWNFEGALPAGWSSENTLEVHASGGSLGNSNSGTRILELDNEGAGEPDALYYNVDTSQGHDHEISLWVKERSGTDGSDEIEVVWNGDVIRTIDPTSSWGEVKITLPGLGLESTKLTIREVADQNSGSGPLIDQITITRLGADTSTNPLYEYEINRNEDTWIPLDIKAALADTDGSETLAVSIAGVPAKFILTDGTNRVVSTGASIDISDWSNNDLTIIPFRDEVIDFTLTVTVTSTETANSEMSTVTKKIRVDMQDVPDLVLSRDSGSIAESALPENFIYVSDGSGRLAEINIETGYTDIIGTMSESMTDIALGPDGVLYGITFGNLYTIDRTDASITAIANGHSSNALTFGPDGTLYSTSGTDLVSIDLDTGESTTLANIGYHSSGDLAYYNGKLYLAANHNDGDSLVEIDVDNNYAVTVIGPIGHSNVFSLSTAGNNKLYGISGTDILEINTETGEGTVTAQLSGLGTVWGSSSVGEARSYIIGNVLTNDPDTSDFLVVTGVSAGDNTGLFYGIEDSNDGTLVTINPITCETTTIANTGINMLELAQDSHGNLYGVDGTILYIINTTDGQPIQIGAHGLTDIKGLTIGNNGTIYALESNGSLYTLNRNTGASNSLGQIGAVGADNSPTDLTFFNGNLYTVGHNSSSTANILVQIDLENSLAATVVGTDMGILGTQGLAVGTDGELYAITTNQLYKVDTSTGAATLEHTLTGLTDIHGLTSVLGDVSTLDNDAVVTPVGTQVVGRFGTLELFSDGSYRYLLDQSNAMVNSLNDGEELYDLFTYSARNKDNHHSQITLSITINGSTDNAVVFTGTGSADTGMGRSGDDTLSGLGGTDTLTGESGNDTIIGDDGASAVSLNIDSSIITAANTTIIGSATGLRGQVFDTGSLSNLNAVISHLDSNSPTAMFNSSGVNYGAVSGTDLQTFLGSDSSSLSGSGTMSDTTFAMRLNGYVQLSSGQHNFNGLGLITSDIHRLTIGGVTISEFDGSGSAAGSFSAGADALYEVELIYWHGSGGNPAVSLSSDSTLTFYEELPTGSEKVNGQNYYSLPTPEVIVSNLPTGGSLSAGTDNGDGTWTVDASDLSTLGLSSTSDWAENVTVTLSNPSGDPAAPLELHYTLDGVDGTTTSITDSSGNGISGSVAAGNLSAGVGDSPNGTHAHFDGSGNIVATQSLGNSVNDATVSFWMKWNGSSSWMVPVSFGSYTLWMNGTNIGFNTFSTDQWGRAIADLELAPGSNGLANEWHYVTATFHHGDSHQSRLWIDGIEQSLSDVGDASQITGNANIRSWPLAIGGEYFAGNFQYEGELDDVRLHGGTVTDNEALQLYLSAVNNEAGEGTAISTHTVSIDQSDMIDGGAGNDILTGGYDGDYYIWHVDDDGTVDAPAEDTITDFQVGSGGDVLDLSDLLVDEENNDLSDHLHFDFSGSDTIVEVTPDTDGSVTQRITLQNTDLSSLGSTDSDIITSLLNSGNLQVDQ